MKEKQPKLIYKEKHLAKLVSLVTVSSLNFRANKVLNISGLHLNHSICQVRYLFVVTHGTLEAIIEEVYMLNVNFMYNILEHVLMLLLEMLLQKQINQQKRIHILM